MAMVPLPVYAAMLFSLVGATVWVKLFDFLARREVLNQVHRSLKQASDFLALQKATSSARQWLRCFPAHIVKWQAPQAVHLT